MVERVIVALLIVVSAVSLWHFYNRRTLWRVRQALDTGKTQTPLFIDLPALTAGTPTILYFTTPYCVPCRTQQAPTLAQLQADHGSSLQVIHIDCEQQPEVADRWGVFSTPTTFILDAAHQPLAVNRGVASLRTLREQLGQTSPRPEPVINAL